MRLSLFQWEEFPNFRALKNATMVPSIPMRSWQDALKEYMQEFKMSKISCVFNYDRNDVNELAAQKAESVIIWFPPC